MKKPFLTTMAGSWLKVFMSAVLLQMLNSMGEGHTLFTFDWEMGKKFINAGVVALLPVLINFFNPQYPLYGTQPKETIVVDNPKV
jgi:hypothetical protein